jgi:hypothetical protein
MKQPGASVLPYVPGLAIDGVVAHAPQTACPIPAGKRATYPQEFLRTDIHTRNRYRLGPGGTLIPIED